MKRTKLLQSIPYPLLKVPEKKKDKVLLVSQIIIDGCKQTLNINLYHEGILKARYFADPEEKQHCAFVDGKWTSNTISNVSRMCRSMVPVRGVWACYSGDYDWASDVDKETALEFLDTYSITGWEEDVSYQKRAKAMQRKKDRIEEMMAAVPTVPEEMDRWLEEEIFPEEYLFVTTKGEREYYKCTKCGASSWKKKKFRQYSIVECPKCRARVKVEKKSDKKFKYANVILLQIVSKDTWVERQFRAEAWWHSDGTRRIDLNENIRAMMPKGMSWGKVYYGDLKNADEFEQEWWDKNTWNRNFQRSYLYPCNLKEVMPFGSLEHTGMEILAEKKIKFNVNRVLIDWCKEPRMEYLIKSGLTNLTAELINHYWRFPDNFDSDAGRLKGFLRIDGNRLSRLKRLNGNLNTLLWLQYEQETGKKITDEALAFLGKSRLVPDRCTEILQAMGSLNRMANYIRKQKVAPSQVIGTWRDYLRMAEEEGMDITDDIIRLPKDLKARHDALVEIRNARKDEERLKKEHEKYRKLDMGILSHLPDARRYFWQDDKYMIIPAGKCEELIKEGRELHHCVGASDIYMRNMAEGRTWILFLRKKDDLEKAYYTIEIRLSDDAVLQWYSAYDRQPDSGEIRAVLDRYGSYLRRQRQRITLTA